LKLAGNERSKTMKRGIAASIGALLLTAIAVLGASAAQAPAATKAKTATTLTGAGATFPFPLISQWIPEYDKLTGVRINYNPIGSGGGITAITNRTVDFGASDAPLSPDQFDACKGCVQIPWALSATAVFYNAPVPNLLRMSGPVLADIYLGKITNWNDARIKKLNPGANLPDLKITPVFRSDNSGTSFNFTDYLSSVSPEWKSKLGKGVTVSWPAGIGGRGSSGVSGVVSRTDGAIGYADIAYAVANKLKYFRIQNKSGKYTTPGLRGIQSAAGSDLKVAANNEMSIVNPPKKFANAYPICTYTYVILPLQTEKAADLKKFVFWALTGGQKFGPRLFFQPIPKHVLVASEKTLKRVHS
jgi:phosphate transport system substrate-binding protein